MSHGNDYEQATDMSHPSNLPGQAACSSEDWNRYTVHSQREILSLLRTIQQQNLLVNLSFAGGDGVISTVLAIDAARNLVVFDGARNEVLNQRLCSAGKVGFATSINGISITFSCAKVDLVSFEQRPALKIALPQELIRLQRRDYFRIMMPIANPAHCLIPPSPGLNPEQLKATIIDLSCGGVAIAENEGRLDMQIGDVLPDCRLLLHDVGPLTVTLEVCNTAQLTLHNGVRKTRLGCRFVDIPANLPSVLQRYILNMEREQLKR